MSSTSFSTPLDFEDSHKCDEQQIESDIIEEFGLSPVTYQARCDSTLKVSFHVFLAALVGNFVPTSVINILNEQVPKLSGVSPHVIRATIIALIYIIISKVMGDLL
jgi:hypothetical protein